MTISVVVPSFNQAEFLGATLDSVFLQSRENVELIVKDGGSTDGSVELLKSRPETFTWTSQKDRGQSDAINQGLRESTGDILAYLNSDDVYLPGTFQKVRAYFEDHPECEILYGDADHLHADGSIMAGYPTEPWNYDRLLATCFICQPAVFWRRSLMQRCGVFDERLTYAMDYEYWLRVGKSAPFHHLPARLAGSRLHAETKTMGQRVKVHREIVQVIQRYSRDSAPIIQWLKHLASITATESGFPASPHPEHHRHHVEMYAAWLIVYGEQLNVSLDQPTLLELETLLDGAEESRV